MTRDRESLLVLITTDSDAEAARLAEALVGERLAACVNIVGPIRSVYRWEGEVQNDEERLLLAKTSADRFDALEARVRELHRYDVPEVVAVPIEAGSPRYLDWLAASVVD